MSSLTPHGRAQPYLPRRSFARTLLYPVFSTVLLLPKLRSWRRRAFWPWVRLAMASLGAGLLLAGHFVLGGLLLVMATLITSARDPDALQELAARLGALHVLNGGHRSGVEMHLFLTETELLLVPAGENHPERIPLIEVEDARIDGDSYRPSYNSFAKAPPTRDANPVTDRITELEVVLKGRPPLKLTYGGAFGSHLAEIVAHTIRARTAQGSEVGSQESGVRRG